MAEPKLKMTRPNKRSLRTGAVFELGDRRITITIDYTPLKKIVYERGFSSWAAFRRYLGITLNMATDINRGRPVTVEVLGYICYMLGTSLDEIIKFNYAEEKAKQDVTLTPRGAIKSAKKAAKKDIEDRIKIEAARKLGLLNTVKEGDDE